MTHREYEDKEYWNTVYRSEEEYIEENCTLEGSDGEGYFDRVILDSVVGKEVVDVGCGVGEFTIKMAERAVRVVGTDFSEEAISRVRALLAKSKIKNVRFELANADRLPLSDQSFDIVVSRRGPVTDNMETIREAYRVLRKGGLLLEITIGEQDKQNLHEIFGMGQTSPKERVMSLKEGMLNRASFEVVEIKEHLATEIFHSLRDLMIRLKNSPIIPDFEVESDRKYLELVEKKCTTLRGIETLAHRVTIVARK